MEPAGDEVPRKAFAFAADEAVAKCRQAQRVAFDIVPVELQHWRFSIWIKVVMMAPRRRQSVPLRGSVGAVWCGYSSTSTSGRTCSRSAWVFGSAKGGAWPVSMSTK